MKPWAGMDGCEVVLLWQKLMKLAVGTSHVPCLFVSDVHRIFGRTAVVGFQIAWTEAICHTKGLDEIQSRFGARKFSYVVTCTRYS